MAVFVAAVADWRTENSVGEKIKKVAGKGPPALQMVENPDILAGIGHHKKRPYLVVGFAAETQDVLANTRAKLKKGGRFHRRQRCRAARRRHGRRPQPREHRLRDGVEEWPDMSKEEVAARLAT